MLEMRRELRRGSAKLDRPPAPHPLGRRNYQLAVRAGEELAPGQGDLTERKPLGVDPKPSRERVLGHVVERALAIGHRRGGHLEPTDPAAIEREELKLDPRPGSE